jgi:vacuolar-type H+-ATPase subunit E/Vma4
LSDTKLDDDQLSERPDDQLAFSRIKAEIETQAKAEAEKNIKQFIIESEEILSTAKETANKIKQELIGKTKNEVTNAKIREISRRKLALKMDFLETREELINEIQLASVSKLQKFTQSDDYTNFLTKLAKQSGLSIGGGQLTLHMRSEDKTLFTQELLKDLAKELSDITSTETTISVSSENLNTTGGLKVIREDHRLYVDNTFETRLSRANEQMRISLLDLLN